MVADPRTKLAAGAASSELVKYMMQCIDFLPHVSEDNCLLAGGVHCRQFCSVHYDVAFIYRLPTGAVLKLHLVTSHDDDSCLKEC